ncbi:MAG: GNAT family N-acetyltransferase [bacterium]
MISAELCTINDSSKLSEMCNEIWHECYEEMLSYEQRVYMLDKFMNENKIKESMMNNCIYYYLYNNDKLAGYFAYFIKDDHIYLSKLYSYKDYRGKSIFKFIFNYFDKYKKDIKLNTCKTNKTLQIYLHVGFEIIDEKKNDIGSGFFMDDYILLKKYE